MGKVYHLFILWGWKLRLREDHLHKALGLLISHTETQRIAGHDGTHTSLNPALGRQSQEAFYEVQASLVYVMRSV